MVVRNDTSTGAVGSIGIRTDADGNTVAPENKKTHEKTAENAAGRQLPPPNTYLKSKSAKTRRGAAIRGATTIPRARVSMLLRRVEEALGQEGPLSPLRQSIIDMLHRDDFCPEEMGGELVGEQADHPFGQFEYRLDNPIAVNWDDLPPAARNQSGPRFGFWGRGYGTLPSGRRARKMYFEEGFTTRERTHKNISHAVMNTSPSPGLGSGFAPISGSFEQSYFWSRLNAPKQRLVFIVDTRDAQVLNVAEFFAHVGEPYRYPAEKEISFKEAIPSARILGALVFERPRKSEEFVPVGLVLNRSYSID